jgi:hypothetical protein
MECAGRVERRRRFVLIPPLPSTLESAGLSSLIRAYPHYYLSKFSQATEIFLFEISNLKSAIASMSLPRMLLPALDLTHLTNLLWLRLCRAAFIRS